MKRNLYLAVFPGADFAEKRELDVIGGALEQGDSIYVIDGNIGFVTTTLSLKVLTERLKRILGTKEQFFLADITNVDRSGNMASRFWEFLRSDEQVAAE